MTVFNDWELWACARAQIDRHGDNAAVHAAMRFWPVAISTAIARGCRSSTASAILAAFGPAR